LNIQAQGKSSKFLPTADRFGLSIRSSSNIDLTGNKKAEDTLSHSSDVGTLQESIVRKSKIERFFLKVKKKNKKHN